MSDGPGSEDAQFETAHMVRFERALCAPLAELWALLTEPALLPGWYGADAMIEEGEGGKVRLMGNHIRGTITQYRRQARLAYSWNVFAGAEEFPALPESYLTIDLIETDAGVTLRFLHGPVLARFEQQNAMGWATFLDMLTAAAHGETVQPRADYMRANAEKYGVDLNALEKAGD